MHSLGYQTDLLVRRLAGAEISRRNGYLVIRTPQNPAFYWGNFVLVPYGGGRFPVAQWFEVFQAEFPQASHIAVGVDALHRPQAEVSTSLPVGIELDVSKVLIARSLRPPVRTPGPIELRPLADDGDWRRLEELRVAVGAADGYVSSDHVTYLIRSVAEARGLARSGRAVFLGAFVADRLVAGLGVVVGRAGLARFQHVETHPLHRRQGLAGSLVHAAGRHAVRYLGARLLVIVADPDGPAISLYRSLGFRETEDQLALQSLPPDRRSEPTLATSR